jgi:hypothetical protein
MRVCVPINRTIGSKLMLFDASGYRTGSKGLFRSNFIYSSLINTQFFDLQLFDKVQ